MAEIRLLSRAPIVEALINFQANAARKWKPDEVRAALSTRWPSFDQIQEIRPVQVEVMRTPEGELPPKITSHMHGFFFRSGIPGSGVHQARRDGYMFSQLPPYTNWASLEQDALQGWRDYQEVLEPEELHAVGIRYINRLEFPLEGFRLARYFTTPPVPPPALGWTFYGFAHQAFYAVQDSPCIVKVTIAPAFDVASKDNFAFVLDIDITLKESLAALGRELLETLAEMHDLKNKAFFNLLTDEALQRYT